MSKDCDPVRRQALCGVGIAAAGVLVELLPVAAANAHEGHDHAPRTILDLKGKLVRIIGPNDDVGGEFIQDRVTIHVNAEGRIVDLVYG
jgi:Peptidase inhibitor I78 family.